MIHHKSRPILYVDDTVEQRYAMRRILETEGFDVLEAGTGQEALDLMKKEPALAVVDVRLPDINGYDLSRQMKEMSPHLQLLQVSASFSDPALRVSGLSGGADAYLAQPVYPSELVTLIRRMLRTAEAEESLRFLATIGPQLSKSLSISDTATNICHAIVPRFASRCCVFLEESPGRAASFFPIGTRDNDALVAAMEAHPGLTSTCRIDSRLLVLPLTNGTKSLGLIAFQLDQNREYDESDLILAQDLASRAALALQNCILFSSEQLTRTALVQSEKLATAGRMAAAIAHEINNPLEALTNLLYIIERSEDTNRAVCEMAGAALAEVTRIAHITRQTLSFYRDLRTPATLNLSQSVSDTVQLYGRRFADKKIALKLTLDDSIHIKGVKGEMRQVIANLLTNALEATDVDGNVQLAVFADQNDAVFTVSDNGPGISDELIGRIFDPFFTTKQGTGTGLGLWITQTIVEKHGGKIRVSTQRDPINHGTSFEVRFAKA